MSKKQLLETKKDNEIKGLKKDSFKQNWVYFLMVLPTAIYFMVFQYIPMSGIVLAFKKYNYAKGIFGSKWIGLNNFRILWDSGKLAQLTKNNITFNIVFLAVGTIINLFTAIIIFETTKRVFKKIAQSATLFPFFISWVVVSALMFNVFNERSGVLNNVLLSLGQEKINIYKHTDMWRYLLIFFNSWKYFGYGTIIYLAALTGIDTSIYESAYIDGANLFQRIRLITLPLLVPTIMISLLLKVGTIMKANFDMFYQLVGTNPYVSEKFNTIEVFVFNAATRGGSANDIGIASAMGLYQGIFGLLLVVITNKLVKRYSKENALF